MNKEEQLSQRLPDRSKSPVRLCFQGLEYTTNGLEGGNLITRPTTGAREYKVIDHLGSTRVVLNGSGTVVSQIDNAPFGEQIAVTGVDTRKQYTDKEVDKETSTGNYGVRHYDPEIGRFWSIDALFEKHPSRSPYHYALNSPLKFIAFGSLRANNIWAGATTCDEKEVTEVVLALNKAIVTGK